MPLDGGFSRSLSRGRSEKPAGLHASDVEEMIEQSVDHAFEDMTERRWTEQRLKSEELLPAVEAALELAGDSLEAEERARILDASGSARAALASEERNLGRLKAANEALDEATQGLAALLVERALEDAADYESR